MFYGTLYALSQGIAYTCSLLLGSIHPFLKPEILWIIRFNAGLMTQQIQQHEIRIDLAIHHSCEIKLNVGLACQAGVVSENTQLHSVGDKSPYTLLGSIKIDLQ